MKSPIATEGTLCTGHDDFPPRPGKASSSGVYVNGKLVHVVGDRWGKHCNNKPSCHEGVVITGSASVLINGKLVACSGDSISCGSKIGESGSTVVVG